MVLNGCGGNILNAYKKQRVNKQLTGNMVNITTEMYTEGEAPERWRNEGLLFLISVKSYQRLQRGGGAWFVY